MLTNAHACPCIGGHSARQPGKLTKQWQTLDDSYWHIDTRILTQIHIHIHEHTYK